MLQPRVYYARPMLMYIINSLHPPGPPAMWYLKMASGAGSGDSDSFSTTRGYPSTVSIESELRCEIELKCEIDVDRIRIKCRQDLS